MIAVRAPYERWADTAPAAGFRSLTRQPSSAAPSNGAQPPAPGAPPELLCSSAGLTCATSSSFFICSRLKLETPAARSFFSRISCSSAAQLQAGGRGKGQGGAGGQGFSTCGGANMAGSPSLIQCVAIAGWQAPHRVHTGHKLPKAPVLPSALWLNAAAQVSPALWIVQQHEIQVISLQVLHRLTKHLRRGQWGHPGGLQAMGVQAWMAAHGWLAPVAILKQAAHAAAADATSSSGIDLPDKALHWPLAHLPVCPVSPPPVCSSSHGCGGGAWR
jgi:hypothetical protein